MEKSLHHTESKLNLWSKAGRTLAAMDTQKPTKPFRKKKTVSFSTIINLPFMVHHRICKNQIFVRIWDTGTTPNLIGKMSFVIGFVEFFFQYFLCRILFSPIVTLIKAVHICMTNDWAIVWIFARVISSNSYLLLHIN